MHLDIRFSFLTAQYQQNTGKLEDAITIMKHCVTESSVYCNSLRALVLHLVKKEDAYVTKYRLSLVELCSALAEMLQEQGDGGSGYARKRNKVRHGR